MLYQTCSQATISPAKKGRALLPGSEARHADVLLPSWHQELDIVLDVTVVSPLQQRLVVRAAEVPGVALTYAYDRKAGQSLHECKSQGIYFSPLPVKTLGATSPPGHMN